MKINWKKLIIALAIPLGTGAVSALITMNAMKEFMGQKQPPLSPPSWLFPVVWTILFILMGIGQYLVAVSSETGDRKRAYTLYGSQLAVNFLWTVVFFCFRLYLVSFLILIALWILIYLTMREFKKFSKTACYLLLPYIIWVTFAGYLNLGVFILN